MPEQNHKLNRQIPGRAALAVVLVLAVILTFGVGLALGRLWEASSTNPSTATSAPQVEPATSPEATAPSPPPTALETTAPSAPPVPIEATNTPSLPTATARPLAFSEGPFVYGHSYNGTELLAYRLGTGPSARALIGGIHGGYEWNTTVLVSETLTHLQENHDLIPPDVTLYIIPCANPDGAAAGTDAVHGRVNGNNVDLNRNWDYQHQVTATHGTRPVYAGDAPFSEPETRALRDFIFDRDIELVIFYHSAMAKIFSGAERENCPTFELAEMMSEVTGYSHSPEGVYGQVTTGDAIDYLSKVGITAIEIELTNHTDIDWDQNWPGVMAFLDWEIPQNGESPQEEGAFTRHLVQPGETLSHLALEYGVDEAAILLANDGIDDPDQILAGQVILIPVESAEP
jgi:LysM repeat protein